MLLSEPQRPQAQGPRLPGRGCSEEQKVLPLGADFRKLEYRREVFLRFYEFHLENRSHPGCVYYVMPWLAKRHKLDVEQRLWLAYLNGNTQNIVTSWLIFEAFPTLAEVKTSKLKPWFDKHYDRLAWDTDRRYHKKDFVKAVECYTKLVQSSQKAYFAKFGRLAGESSFSALWAALRADFYTFGRLSAFSYSEYLRIMGVDIACSTLFLRDLPGSRSHRNGLAKVLGRDDMDWYKETGFKGDYTEAEFVWLEEEALSLLEEARERVKSNKRVDPRDVGYFTLESALCTFKSWHRKNRRFPNCYQDMFHDRIKLAEERWGKEAVEQFWECRADCQPEHLLLEYCPKDPGLVPAKQNYYRETGHVIMMSKRWPEFDNPFDRNIWS